MPPGIGYGPGTGSDRSRFNETDDGLLGSRALAFRRAARAGQGSVEGMQARGIGMGLMRGSDLARLGAAQGRYASRLGAQGAELASAAQRERDQAERAFLRNRDAVRAEYQRGIESVVRGARDYFPAIVSSAIKRDRARPGANERAQEFDTHNAFGIDPSSQGMSREMRDAQQQQALDFESEFMRGGA